MFIFEAYFKSNLMACQKKKTRFAVQKGVSCTYSLQQISASTEQFGGNFLEKWFKEYKLGRCKLDLLHCKVLEKWIKQYMLGHII